MKKFKRLTYALLVVCFVFCSFIGCSQKEALQQEVIPGRIKMTQEEFFILLQDPTDFDNYQYLQSKYDKTYYSKAGLCQPKQVCVATKSGFYNRNEINHKDALDFLLNGDNVFQYYHYVFYVSDDYSSIKMLLAADYDDFLRSVPENIHDIPWDIVMKEGLTYPIVTKAGDFNQAACAWCVFGLLAAACGAPVGLLEVIMCIECAQSISDGGHADECDAYSGA